MVMALYTEINMRAGKTNSVSIVDVQCYSHFIAEHVLKQKIKIIDTYCKLHSWFDWGGENTPLQILNLVKKVNLVLCSSEAGGLVRDWFKKNMEKIEAKEAEISWLSVPLGQTPNTLAPTFPTINSIFS